MDGIVFNIQKFCLHDGPGIRTSVFLKGCPLRCEWCHNPESQHAVPEMMFHRQKCSLCGKCLNIPECSVRRIESADTGIILDRTQCTVCGKCAEICLNDANEICGKRMSVSEVIDEVKKDKIFYKTSGGGMTITGGEPSAQPEFSIELIKSAAEYGISSAIETCGFGKPEFFRKAAELGAVFLYDLKAMDSDKHKRLTGADNRLIHQNLCMLMDMGADITLRLPLIPEVNDSDEDLMLIAEFMKAHKGRFSHAEIMPYHSMGVGKAESIGKTTEIHAEGEQFTELWINKLENYGCKVVVSK